MLELDWINHLNFLKDRPPLMAKWDKIVYVGKKTRLIISSPIDLYPKNIQKY